MSSSSILADENIPKSVISWFRERGYDIISATDVGLKGATDSALFKHALKNELIILTLDEDFVGLYRQMSRRVGVIVVRTHPATPERIKRLLSSSLSEFQINKHSKELIVITEQGIRIGLH